MCKEYNKYKHQQMKCNVTVAQTKEYIVDIHEPLELGGRER